MFERIKQHKKIAQRIGLLQFGDDKISIKNKSFKRYKNFRPLLFLFGLYYATYLHYSQDDRNVWDHGFVLTQEKSSRKKIHQYLGVVKVAEDIYIIQNVQMYKKNDTFESFLNMKREQTFVEEPFIRNQASFQFQTNSLFSGIFQDQSSIPQNPQVKNLQEKALLPFLGKFRGSQNSIQQPNEKSLEVVSPIDLEKKNCKIKSNKKFVP